jgi:hypothetical protein
VKKNIPMVITVANGQKMYSEARSGTDRGKMENKVADALSRRKAGTSVQLVQGVQTAL